MPEEIIEQHLPLNTPMVHWPRLQDVLDEVMHNVERNVWNEEFEEEDNLDEGTLDREPDSMSRAITPPEQALRSVPRLHTVLDEALRAYELPDHAWNILEHAFQGSVNLVEQALTEQERRALWELARQSIQEGPEEMQKKDPRTDPEYRLQGTTTQNVIDEYWTLTAEPGEGGRMPDWDDLPEAEQVRLIEICQETLEQDPACDLLSIVAENLDSDFAR